MLSRLLAVTLLGIFVPGGCKNGGVLGGSTAIGNRSNQDQKPPRSP